MTSCSQCETRLKADRDSKKRWHVVILQKQCMYNYPTISPKRKHQEETPEHAKPGLRLKEKGPDYICPIYVINSIQK